MKDKPRFIVSTVMAIVMAFAIFTAPAVSAAPVAVVSSDQIVVATHRATEPCVKCSRFNVFCKLGNFLARCNSGH